MDFWFMYFNLSVLLYVHKMIYQPQVESELGLLLLASSMVI